MEEVLKDSTYFFPSAQQPLMKSIANQIERESNGTILFRVYPLEGWSLLHQKLEVVETSFKQGTVWNMVHTVNSCKYCIQFQICVSHQQAFGICFCSASFGLGSKDPGMWSTVEDYVKFCQMLLTGPWNKPAFYFRQQAKTLFFVWRTFRLENNLGFFLF